MRVVVAGGSGFIGRHLIPELAARGHEVVVLTRGPRLVTSTTAVRWSGRDVEEELLDALRAADAVVNLAGAPVAPKPWTAARRRLIRSSRVQPTETLVAAIAALAPHERPRVLVNASGTDTYTGRDTSPATEEDGPPAAGGFLADVCEEWEAAATKAQALGVRVVLIRTGFVVARDSRVTQLMALPFRLFLGGPLGDGRQWMSWIHIEDLVRLFAAAVEDDRLRGPINGTAPNPVRQEAFARAIARALRRPSWLRVPAVLLRLAMRDQAVLALGSRRILPRRALDAGFSFRYPEVEGALEEALAT